MDNEKTTNAAETSEEFDFANMSILEAQKLGVERYRMGFTFAARDVLPKGFVVGAVMANRSELIEAVNHGWHVANLAEPVEISGEVYVSLSSAEELQRICES